MEIILASSSPRRRELLEMLGVANLRIKPASGKEVINKNLSPEKIVRELSWAKACEIAAISESPCLVLAADTVVFIDGKILGKPKNPCEAEKMLELLSGKCHKVFTGITAILNQHTITEIEETSVFFRKLDPSEIKEYVKTGEPMDKAGAYGIQGIGSLFIERLEGDYYNVMGLPLCRLQKMLKKLGVNLI